MSGIKPLELNQFYRKLHARGMTTTKLAELVGRARPTLSRVLNGYRRRGPVWLRIRQHLTPDEIALLDSAMRSSDCVANKPSRKLERARYYAANKDKMDARSWVCRAVKRGWIERPSLCSACGNPGIIEAHHADYSKPRDVEWLCDECHRARHREADANGTMFPVEHPEGVGPSRAAPHAGGDIALFAPSDDPEISHSLSLSIQHHAQT
jgi:transcriptional regulator with XRE-family HTH domain